MFVLRDAKLRNPWLNLAIDEAITQYYGRSKFPGLVRLWMGAPAICLGRTDDVHKNAPVQLMEDEPTAHKSIWKNRISLMRRASGGGTVLHGPGNWNYSIFLSLEQFPEVYPVKQSYELFLGMVTRALSDQVAVRSAGQSDLVVKTAVGTKKISGNSQFRKHGICAHHGTLLADPGLIESISNLLPHPPKEPDYRSHRKHSDFLGSLPSDFSIDRFFGALVTEVSGFTETEATPLSKTDTKNIFQLAAKLTQKTYTRRSWILEGRTD
ncbi:MAG: lipoate--protein ligase family protein [Spirochaetia bacterium]|nr:lipoate--protein ligase family protein [Spirochaetia bacterium]